MSRRFRHWPGVILKELQLSDGIKPVIDLPLRLYGGRLYRGVTLTKAITPTPTHTGETFIATHDTGLWVILRPHSPVRSLAMEQWPIIEFDQL